jgi:hydrophobe/amphiphile efflux-1 (HAE1) family protein
MEQLSQESSWPDGLEYQVPFDSTLFVEASIAEVYSTLFVAAVLVIGVIYLFLQDWRATVVPVAAIPVSLIGTFAVMSGIGFSINMLSLFGIVLAIGIVVDDAIVVVENTTRHIEDGLPSREAAVKAMEEMTGPIIATTLVLLAVFVPSAFMGGITGQLFKQFALTISAAVILSTINALTLSPALCGLLLRAPSKKKFFAFRWFDAGFDWVTNIYGSIIGRLVRVVSLVAIVYLGLVVLTGWSFARLPTGFVPDEDQGYFFVNIQLPDAASQQRTDSIMRQLESDLGQMPGVADIVSVIGYSMLSGTAGSNNGFMVVVLEPWEDRKTRTLRLGGLMAAAQAKFRAVEGAIVFAFAPPPIDGLGAAGGFQMEVLDKGGAGYDQLQGATANLIQLASSQSKLKGLNSTFRANVPQLAAEVDREKVKNLGVSLDSVFGTMQAYLGSAYVNDFTYDGRSYQVRLQADAKYRSRAEDITSLELRDLSGSMIPLGSMVEVDETFGPSVVRRYNLYPAASVNGSGSAGVSSGEALDLMEEVAGAALPPAMGFEWTGISYQERVAAGGQGFVLLLAVIFVFLVLAAQYESWTSPAAVIAVVPLAALGVVLALMLRGADNNTYTQIGVVLLIALASKNAILIVEFARELMAKGRSLREAAAEAARLRFRAILMTAFSSILGFLPLLVAAGAGAASRQAVGNAVVGGMMAATVFSLLFVPSFFVIFTSLSPMNAGAKTNDKADT